MVLLLRKLYLYLTKDPEGVHYLPGGNVKLFPGGGDVKLFPGGGGCSNANFFRNPYTFLLFFRGVS